MLEFNKPTKKTKLLSRRLLLLVTVMAWPALAQNQAHGGTQDQVHALYKNHPVPNLSYKVVNIENHDKRSFTQGWEISKGFIYESSGGYGKSFIRKSQHPSNKVVLEKRLPKNWFAEGLTLIGDKLYLLSWRQQKGLLLNSKDLKPLAQFTYSGEGWGLCNMNNEIYMSNGSDNIQVFNSRFELQRQFSLSRNNEKRTDKRWQNLNELECAKGLIWANLWQEKRVIAIDPKKGLVKYQLDIEDLGPKTSNADAVLNGIAYDPETDGFWFTGKLWSKRYLLALDLPQKSHRATQSAD